jgi:glycine cleavage system transcriptional repressor
MSTQEQFVVLSALAPDRPGLVAEVTAYVNDRLGNVEESRMLILGAEFGVMLLISGTEDAVAKITSEAEQLKKRIGGDLIIRRTKSPEEHRRGERKPIAITAESFDRVGIVKAIASAISDLGLNIVDLETTAVDAAFTGATLFKIEARVDVPRGTPMSKIRAAMEDVAAREHLDVDVRSLS